MQSTEYLHYAGRAGGPAIESAKIITRLSSPRLPALSAPEFRSYLVGIFLSNVGSQIQTWAIAWHLYVLTGSSYVVGLLGLARVVPRLALSLFGGVVADHADRRVVLLFSQSAMAAVALGLGLAEFSGVVSPALLFSAVVLIACAQSFDAPARQSLMVNLVPVRDLANALSLTGIAWRLSDVIGPATTGFLVASQGLGRISGLGLCYWINFFSFTAVLIAVAKLRPMRAEQSGDRPRTAREVISQIREGVRFVHNTPVVRHSMFIDFWATFFSAADALLPAFATAILALGPEGYGLLASSAATGALIAALTLALRRNPVVHQGRLVVWMVGAYGLATVGFGLSQSLWMAMICLAGTGAADMVSTVMRQTIRQLATPDAMRGRMSAYSSLYFISGPQLGDVESGIAAKFWGERVAVVAGGAACVGVAMIWSRAKALVGYQVTN